LLNQGAPAGTPVAISEWKLVVQGPNGVEQWDWPTREGLPTKSTILSVDGASSGTVAAAALSNTTTAAPPTTTPAEGEPEFTAPEPTTSDEPSLPTD
jgi:hypothetical protein